MVEPKSVHWIGAKHVLRYIAGSMDYGLDYVRGDGVRLIGYIDSDWAGCGVDRKSISGYCFGLGSIVVSWFSRKHKSVALSSAEAEYMAASQASCALVREQNKPMREAHLAWVQTSRQQTKAWKGAQTPREVQIPRRAQIPRELQSQAQVELAIVSGSFVLFPCCYICLRSP
jgi:hypothetical protein